MEKGAVAAGSLGQCRVWEESLVRRQILSGELGNGVTRQAVIFIEHLLHTRHSTNSS